jgi:hypothetical protein
MGGECSTHGERKSITTFLLGKPEGKKSLGRTRYRLAGIKMDFKETVWQGLDWINLAQDTDR